MAKQNTAHNLAQQKETLKLVAKVASKEEDSAMNSIIHERTRLAIVSALAVNPALGFNELKDLLSLSDGNLSVHSQRLEKAGYITCEKKFRGRTPYTEFKLSKEGRAALERYLGHMEAIIKRVSRKK
jgi:DNA-binding transcriptional ArsR family regulator